jgi:hypothetical protein
MHIRCMKPIQCKRPVLLLPKAIGETQIFNFYGRAGLLTVLTRNGRLYTAYESSSGIELRDKDGHVLEKGPVYRFILQHIDALKDGVPPSLLTSVHARRKTQSRAEVADFETLRPDSF